MNSNQTKQLQLGTLEQRLEQDRDLGGLIYIKQADENNQPMNFIVKGISATSGNWRFGLTKKKLTWMLIYQHLEQNRGQVWIGEYDHISQMRTGAYKFHLSNVAGPLVVEKSLYDLVGKIGPQNPVYLSISRTAQATSKSESELVDDLGAISNGDTPIPIATETAQRILARLGQGKFRNDVLKLWDGACAVTGCTTLEVIRASHIKPWRNSNDKDRLNPQNGLPLAATLDSLFDCGLISFSNKGEMLISPRLYGDARELFGVPAKLRKVLNDEQRQFLKYHRKHIFARDL